MRSQKINEGIMKLAYAFLADAAQVTADGKFSILGGGIEILTTSSFPAQLSSLSLIARFQLNHNDFDIEHPLILKIEAPDGSNLLKESGETIIKVNRPQIINNMPLTFSFISSFIGLSFPEAGKYLFQLYIDQEKLEEISLYLILQMSELDIDKEKE